MSSRPEDVTPECKAALGFLECSRGVPLISDGPSVLMTKDSETILPHVYRGLAGEAEPLFIRLVEFFDREIAQTLPYPCALNTICVTLTPSVPLTVQRESYFVLESLDGAKVPPGEIALSSTANAATAGQVTTLQSAFQNGNVSKGIWNLAACDGSEGSGKLCSSIKLSVACRIEAGTEISFCFQVTNPAVEQDGPESMTIYSSLGGVFQQLQYSTELLSVPYATAIDQRPMHIRTPAFRALEIEQSSPFPCDDNTITVSFKTNVRPVCVCRLAPHALSANPCKHAFTVFAALRAHVP